jgi:hypothetical protein
MNATRCSSCRSYDHSGIGCPLRAATTRHPSGIANRLGPRLGEFDHEMVGALTAT